MNSCQESMLSAWVNAFRPKTLTASAAPVLVSTILAKAFYHHVDWFLAVMALASAICVQMGTNLINDAYDFKRGADNDARLGPVRLVQHGILSAKLVFNLGMIAFALALVFGIPLILKGGLWMLAVLLVSCLLGFLYTGGPRPLAYNAGYSEIAVITFFGVILSTCVYYIQTDFIELPPILAGLQLGLLSAVLLAINNVRDHASDALANKNTFAVRYGVWWAKLEITTFLLGPYILGGAWFLYNLPFVFLLPVITLPIALKLVKSIWDHEPSKLYNSFLGLAGALQLIFGFLMALGLYFG